MVKVTILSKKGKKREYVYSNEVFELLEEQFIPLYEKGFYDGEIAKVLGLSNTEINSYRCYLQLDSNQIFDRLRRKFPNIEDSTFKKIISVYDSMWNRCHNPSDKAYTNYGGRGIDIADVWNKDRIDKPRFARYNFVVWALENGYREGLTIDRINNDGNYAPENCSFRSRRVQMNNTRISKNYIEKICPVCGKSFKTKDNDQIYDTKRCSNVIAGKKGAEGRWKNNISNTIRVHVSLLARDFLKNNKLKNETYAQTLDRLLELEH